MSGNSYRAKPSNATKAGVPVHTIRRTGEPATIYLLCSEYKHYIGMTERPLGVRLGEHYAGNGSTHTTWLREHNYQLRLAREWPNRDKCVEFYLKAWGGARPFCPICSGKIAWTRARYEDFIIEPSDETAEEMPF